MATYFEAVLPSGRCIRFKALKTREKLEIDRRVEALNGDSVSTMIQTVATCVVAVTPPVPLVLDASGAVNVDATLNGVLATTWSNPTFEQWITDGPTHVTDVFESLPDFQAVLRHVQDASGVGPGGSSLLSGKARVVSAAS